MACICGHADEEHALRFFRYCEVEECDCEDYEEYEEEEDLD